MAKKLTQLDIENFEAEQAALVAATPPITKRKRKSGKPTGQWAIDQLAGVVSGMTDLPANAINAGGQLRTSLANWTGEISAEEKAKIDEQLKYMTQNPSFFSNKYNEGKRISRETAPMANNVGEVIGTGVIAKSAMAIGGVTNPGTSLATQAMRLPNRSIRYMSPTAANGLAGSVALGDQMVEDPIINQILQMKR